MNDGEPRKPRTGVGTAIALIVVLLVPLTAVFIPTPTEARTPSYSNRLAEVNEQISDLLDRLVVLYRERDRLIKSGYSDGGNPGYVDPRLGQAHATVYTYDSSKKTKVEVYYDRKKQTFYTSAKTRSGIVSAISRNFDVSQTAVERVLTITYVRDDENDDWNYSYGDNWDWSRDTSYRDDPTRDYNDYDSGDRWWGDATYGYISEEELAQEKATWYDDDGY